MAKLAILSPFHQIAWPLEGARTQNCGRSISYAEFPPSRFFSANRRFVGARANNFWQYSEHSFRKFDKFVEI